ncbi:hypothetical protein RFM98_02875 [Mesorhizobium sp. VK9D]|uniref:hypothetical protein n=1 Tax=Mesorhizobium australafricanum TaxID=3072311 RepID=UPI002A243FC0|nr:hypothetical protein [Mesorhizobium sp. VK9D]MDX8451691.1 hypothetical protein [Mesorhizobium sp. VK9D]
MTPLQPGHGHGSQRAGKSSAGRLGPTWAFEFAFTMLTALYQFVVLGVRLYFPPGFAALVAASIWFARQRR